MFQNWVKLAIFVFVGLRFLSIVGSKQAVKTVLEKLPGT